MLTIEKLREFGANVDEGMSRCNMALQDGGFERLHQAVESGDKKEGFEAAHALKGMLGNLSLTPLVEPTSEMTELLRAGKDEDYQAWWNKIREQRDKLLAMRDEA